MKARKDIWLSLCTTISLVTALALAVITSGCNSRFSSPTSTTQVATSGFVTRSGSQLMLNGHPFRFAGANMHWLALDDSASYPSSFRVNDGLDAAKEMGATVVRAHTLGISTGCRNCIEPSLGLFNETAFEHVDYAIKAAQDRGLRLIIPLTDNWHFAHGGKHNFTDWRGISDENQFYSNTQVIGDFETYISTLLNHVNTYTGVTYKNDPTILAWESGNELDPPVRWTQTISTYIKGIDTNHLVMDGKNKIDASAATLTNVDIVTAHYYPMSISKVKADAAAAKSIGKAFIIGEFDWNYKNNGDHLDNFLSTIESDPVIAGDIFWELWSHSDQYGYVDNEPQYMLHYPGDSAAMRMSVRQLRTHAYRIRQISVSPDSTPGVPLIEVVIRGAATNMLVWRGTAVAASYTVERSTQSAHGPWTTICDRCATDISTPWEDKTAPSGNLWYRVTAYNLAGVAGRPSSPYQASSRQLIVDSLNDWDKTYSHTHNLTFDTTHAEQMHADSSVVIRTTATQESITWKRVAITSFQATAYFWPYEPVIHLSISTSSDGHNWTLSHPEINEIGGNWLEYVYTLKGLSGVDYIMVSWNNTSAHPWDPALGEVTLTY